MAIDSKKEFKEFGSIGQDLGFVLGESRVESS